MATTLPRTFPSTLPELTPEKVAVLVEWYESALGDCDKASDIEDNEFYDGYASALRDALDVLHFGHVYEPLFEISLKRLPCKECGGLHE